MVDEKYAKRIEIKRMGVVYEPISSTVFPLDLQSE
jgi:hypothetical protein